MNYTATIQQKGRVDGIYTAGPYHTSVETSGGNSDATKYNGQKVQVIAEAVTTRAGGTTYNRVKLANGQTFWIDKRGFDNDDSDLGHRVTIRFLLLSL